MEKCGRPPLPPSNDPKVQAKREKARANAQKKREGVKQTKAVSTIAGAIKRKLTTDDSKTKATAKAVSTIAGAIKRKLTLVSVKPAKKIDDNRLHNLPEDLQKKIMGMANEKWNKDGISSSVYKVDWDRDIDMNFISPYSVREDLDDEMFEDGLGESFKRSVKDDMLYYEWSDNKNIKDPKYKKKMETSRKKAINPKLYNKKWDKKNSRMLLFVFNKYEDYYVIIPDITDLSNKKDKYAYDLTYGYSGSLGGKWFSKTPPNISPSASSSASSSSNNNPKGAYYIPPFKGKKSS